MQWSVTVSGQLVPLGLGRDGHYSKHELCVCVLKEQWRWLGNSEGHCVMCVMLGHALGDHSRTLRGC